jgi:serine protease Do
MRKVKHGPRRIRGRGPVPAVVVLVSGLGNPANGRIVRGAASFVSVMNPSLRRLLSLAAVFAVAFSAVSLMRRCASGSRGNPEAFRPETFTLPEHAPLDSSDVGLLSRLNQEYAKLTGAVVPSVVSINTAGVRTQRLYDLWGNTRLRRFPTQGQGSGVIVSEEGHVVTNHHVIADQQEIRVALHGGVSHPARLIGQDPLLDIAVLKIDAKGPFPSLKLGDSSKVEVGQIVFAIGNPFGLGETVTQGIISAKERSLSDNQRDLFQTDAAINPGNSGGPLVNITGEIIGINVAIFSPDRQNPGFQGVGFSIPSNDVRDALRQILERGRPMRGFLGVQMFDLDEQIRASIGYGGESGVLVMRAVPGSPAEAAGVKSGDVLLRFDGRELSSASQLLSLVQSARIDAKVKLTLWRRGEVIELEAIIKETGDVPLSPGLPPEEPGTGPDPVIGAVGIEVRDLSVRERMQGFRGALVTAVAAQGLAAGGIRQGDLVQMVDSGGVQGSADFYRLLSASIVARDTRLIIVRDNRRMTVVLPSLARVR